MALKLKRRELPTVEITRKLPDYLGPEGQGCYISFKARVSGAANPAYLATLEGVMQGYRLTRRKLEKLASGADDAAYVAADLDAATAMIRAQWAALYDACVLEWDSNVQAEDDFGQSAKIKCDRETFMALTEERTPAIASALIDLQTACKTRGDELLADDEALAKN